MQLRVGEKCFWEHARLPGGCAAQLRQLSAQLAAKVAQLPQRQLAHQVRHRPAKHKLQQFVFPSSPICRSAL